jgi:hypothetical protein
LTLSKSLVRAHRNLMLDYAYYCIIIHHEVRVSILRCHKYESACPRHQQIYTTNSGSRTPEMKSRKPEGISGELVTIPVEIGQVRTDQPAQ